YPLRAGPFPTSGCAIEMSSPNCAVEMSSHGDLGDRHDESQGGPPAGPVQLGVAGKIITVAGARALKMTPRQFRRLKARYRIEGIRGLVHRRRGQPSGRGLDGELHDRVIELIHHVPRLQ